MGRILRSPNLKEHIFIAHAKGKQDKTGVLNDGIKAEVL
jgi:hypothetical protein